MQKISWKDYEEIGFRLAEKYPGLDPLTLRFTDLRDKVKTLDGFVEEPGVQENEKILEAVQMAWLEEFKREG